MSAFCVPCETDYPTGTEFCPDCGWQMTLRKRGEPRAIVCPVHGAGYGRCLGCLSEAAAAKVFIEDGGLVLTPKQRWWTSRFPMEELIEMGSVLEELTPTEYPTNAVVL